MVLRSFGYAWLASLAWWFSAPLPVQAAEAERLPARVTAASNVLLQAEERYAEADFEGALEALERAEQVSLSRADVLRSYSLRSLVHYALGEETAMREDLQVLALLAPAHELGPTAPPAVRQAFEEVRAATTAPLRLDVQLDKRHPGVRISAHSHGGKGGIVREVRVLARVNDGPWVEGDGRAVELAASAGDVVEYYATLLGPGGSVLLERGTAQAPLQWRLPAPSRSHPWLWGLVGIAVGAAGTALVMWISDGRGDRGTVLSEPQLRW
jgi:hypothetical protein